MKPVCPSCNIGTFRVRETRTTLDTWYRIRECKNCGERFLTKEEVISKKRTIK
tara:strand:+ start:332 stop:490 length:159 start_codon:yes stop_codon:yes gene_type:complete